MHESILLYIGDDPEVVSLLKQINAIQRVEQVQNGFIADKWLEVNSLPYGIVCEDTLHGISGLHVHETMYRNIKLQTVPFLLLEKNVSKEIRKRAFHQGIDDIFTKPLEIDKLQIRLLFLHDFKSKKSLINVLHDKHVKVRIPLSKRMFDILFAFFVLLFISPILLLIIILIRLESKGPVFYLSKRVGQGYRIFDFYKFRSMYVGADAKLKELKHLNQYVKAKPTADDTYVWFKCPECERLGRPCSPILIVNDREICERLYQQIGKKDKEGAFIKIANDPRITRVGNFIRKTSIDELPQLINVLKGDMSIVGNRPIPLYEAELLTSDKWTERFMAPSGITGLWQVTKRGKKEMSDDERKELDNIYARNFGFWYDIKLILKTIPALIQKENV